MLCCCFCSLGMHFYYLGKSGVLTIGGEIPYYRNDHYFYYDDFYFILLSMHT